MPKYVFSKGIVTQEEGVYIPLTKQKPDDRFDVGVLILARHVLPNAHPDKKTRQQIGEPSHVRKAS